jgi:hypothetical protein
MLQVSAPARRWRKNTAYEPPMTDEMMNLRTLVEKRGQHSVNTAAPPISIGSVGAALSGGPLIGDDFL